MRTFLRSLILLALAIWVGGLLFFGAVVAPIAFGTLMPMFQDPLWNRVAGTMVRSSLLHLHAIGMVCGIALLVLAIAERVTRATRRSIAPQLVLIAAMVGSPRIRSTLSFHAWRRCVSRRAQLWPTPLPPIRRAWTSIACINLSTTLEGIVLVCGFGLIVLYARPEPTN